MATIISKFLGASNSRPSRIKATTGDKNPATGKHDSVTVSYNHALNGLENHMEAVKALNAKMGWGAGDYVVGQSEDGYIFVRSCTVLTITEEG